LTDDLSKMNSGPITGVMAGRASVHVVDQGAAISTRAGGEVVSADWSGSSAGVQFVMGDGSVRGIR
jgi:hypothetical protein